MTAWSFHFWTIIWEMCGRSIYREGWRASRLHQLRRLLRSMPSPGRHEGLWHLGDIRRVTTGVVGAVAWFHCASLGTMMECLRLTGATFRQLDEDKISILNWMIGGWRFRADAAILGERSSSIDLDLAAAHTLHTVLMTAIRVKEEEVLLVPENVQDGLRANFVPWEHPESSPHREPYGRKHAAFWFRHAPRRSAANARRHSPHLWDS